MSSKLTDLLLEVSDPFGTGDIGPIKLPLQIQYHPNPVDYKDQPTDPFWSVDLMFDEDSEEYDFYQLDGDPISGFGSTVEEAMNQFMEFMNEFANLPDLYQFVDKSIHLSNKSTD